MTTTRTTQSGSPTTSRGGPICRSCNVRRVPTARQDADAHGIDLCRPCLNEAELENEHSDYGHDELVKGCPFCGLANPTPEASAPVTRSVSTAETNGLHTCPVCLVQKGSKKFPTKRDQDGVYVRDLRQCRQCRDAKRVSR